MVVSAGRLHEFANAYQDDGMPVYYLWWKRNFDIENSSDTLQIRCP